MSKAYWNGVLSRLPDFCRNMGKTAMMGAMMAEYNSHGHHHCCCGPSIWGYGPGMGGGYYWNNMAGMGGMYPMGYYGGYRSGYMNQGIAQNGSYSTGQIINPNYVQTRMNEIYGIDDEQNGSQNPQGQAAAQNPQGQAAAQNPQGQAAAQNPDVRDID